MKHIITLKSFELNENFNPIVLSEIKDDEIKVYEDNIRRLLNFIGEGVDDITITSINKKAKFIRGGNTPAFFPKYDEFQNEITIIFWENSMGGIDMKDWQKADEILGSIQYEGGFTGYSINPSDNAIILEFESDLPIGLY